MKRRGNKLKRIRVKRREGLERRETRWECKKKKGQEEGTEEGVSEEDYVGKEVEEEEEEGEKRRKES